MFGIKIASLALVASVVLAQQLPECANQCLLKASGQTYAGCNQYDIACICNSKDWIAGLACCVSTACSPADQDGTIAYANTICSGAGVNNLPQKAGCANSAAASSAAAATTVSVTGSTSLPAASSILAIASTASVNATTAAVSSGSTTGTVSRTTTGSAAAATTSGAANMNKVGAYGLGAFMAVAAAL